MSVTLPPGSTRREAGTLKTQPERGLVSRLQPAWLEVAMMERQRVLSALQRWFPGASDDVIDGAANAIVGVGEEWEEVTSKEEELGYHYSPRCPDICYLADQFYQGAEFRLFRKRRARSW
jgi:hypothetical protein